MAAGFVKNSAVAVTIPPARSRTAATYVIIAANRPMRPNARAPRSVPSRAAITRFQVIEKATRPLYDSRIAPLGNGVTVAQQTLTLFVLVRIQVPQPAAPRRLPARPL